MDAPVDPSMVPMDEGIVSPAGSWEEEGGRCDAVASIIKVDTIFDRSSTVNS
jgi:hypothetical protein